MLNLLSNLTEDLDQSTETRSEARVLYNRMLSYDFLTLLGFWSIVLASIDRVQKRLQDPSMNFRDAALDIKSLRDHFSGEREILVNAALEKGINICKECDVETERRQRRKKRMPGENLRDAGLTAKEEIERVMKGSLDRIVEELNARFNRLNETDEKFGFLLDAKNLCYGTDNLEHLKKKCEGGVRAHLS